jgi:ribonucleotide reductase beta subunit family protein with ferritin-like domain
MKVVIYSKPGCVLCDVAQDIANEWEIQTTKKLIDSKELKELTGETSYPQIMINDEHIGNHLEFDKFIKNNHEPILHESYGRFSTFPIKYHDLWELYKNGVASFWTVEEIDLSKDMEDWKSLSQKERHFVSTILAFFASSDGIVMENISVNFSREVQISEARSFYAFQEFNESIHGETYSLLIEKYITDPIEKMNSFNAIENIQCVKDKANWALNWFDTSRPFRERIVAFACVEGIFFSGSFCAIFWLKKRGLLPGLSFSNELISRDEALHLDFAVAIFHHLINKPSEDIVHDIVLSAVNIEKEFILEALPCKLIGMDNIQMSQYIEFVADRLLKQLGYTTIWNTKNPFEFMEAISLEGKTNFFEKRVGDYGKYGVGLSAEDNTITFDEEF